MAGDKLVGVAGLGGFGVVDMRKDVRGRIVLENFRYDFVRVHTCAADRAAEQALAGDQPVRRLPYQ